MKIDQLDINALKFGIMCNFAPFCGEERAKESVEIVRELERLAKIGEAAEQQYTSFDSPDFDEGARLIKLGLAIGKVFELYPIILGASSDHAKDPGPRAWKDADELLEWYEKEVGTE